LHLRGRDERGRRRWDQRSGGMSQGQGDAVDLGPGTRDPYGVAPLVPRGGAWLRAPRQAGGRPAQGSAFKRLGRDARCRSQAATPWLSLRPFWQTTTAERPWNSGAHWATVVWERRTAPGRGAGRAAKSSSVWTSTMTGPLGVPIRRASLSSGIVLRAGMRRPSVEQDAILQHVASWGDRSPHGRVIGSRARDVNLPLFAPEPM
jgi:hypothetical protein